MATAILEEALKTLLGDSIDAEKHPHKNHGLIGTIIFHAILLLLFLLFALYSPFPPPEEEGMVAVNFGTVDTGFGDEQPTSPTDEPVPQESQQPDEQPNEMETPVETQSVEESVALPEPEKPNEAIKPSEETPTTPTEPVEETPKEPVLDPRANFKAWKSDKENKSSDGNNKPGGDMGKPDGRPDASSFEGGPNMGQGDRGFGFDLKGRSLVKPPDVNDQSQKTGTVVIRIKVDRMGNVIFAEYIQRGSNTTDAYLISLAKKAAMETKFNQAPKALVEQVGTITFNFRVE